MQRKKYLCLLLSVFSIQAFALDYHEDSVFDSSTQIGVSSQNVKQIVYRDFQNISCPSGFSFNGSSVLPVKIRTVTDLYEDGVLINKTYSDWYDLPDNYCTSTEYQQIACPAHQTGLYYQSRTIKYDVNGLRYDPWQSYANTCQSVN